MNRPKFACKFGLFLICCAQAPEFEVISANGGKLNTYLCPSEDTPNLNSLVAKIRADHIGEDLCEVFYGDIRFSRMKLDDFGESSHTVRIKPVECVVTSHRPGYRVNIGRGIFVIISDVMPFEHPPGAYSFRSIDLFFIDVFKVTINNIECDLFKVDRNGFMILPAPKFTSELRELLFGVQVKLSQADFNEIQTFNALSYLLVEHAYKERGMAGVKYILDGLQQHKELADKIRPEGPELGSESEFTSVFSI